MLNLPVLRWGDPYQSLETATLVDFRTGEPVAKVGQANGMMVTRDMRKADQARATLRKIPIEELVGKVAKAAELYMTATLPMGDGTQSPDEFVKAQCATTGLPEHMCRSNMTKNEFVLRNMPAILTAMTRGLDLNILTRGHGVERGVQVSWQCQSPVLGLVLPSNSPGVHALWMPIIPMQIGLVMKPGAQEPWTPYRIASAMIEAGIPKSAIAIYPGPAPDVGGAILNNCRRSLIFGGQHTVDQYKSNPRVQPHGPGFSKVFLGADKADEWEKHLDLMVTSVCANGGRSCINASGIWVTKHAREIADALAKRFAAIKALAADHPEAPLAAFTDAKMAEAINNGIEADLKLPGVTDVTAKYRDGSRLEKHDRYAYLLPTVTHVAAHDSPAANREYLFPFCSVVECPQEKMIEAMGPTLIGSAITDDETFREQLLQATNIDRLNFGAIPTVKINWLQPHEGNIVDFLFRTRAFQS